MHIHVLQLTEILLALKSFIKTNHNRIKVISDMGISRSMECHHQVLRIWEWAISHKNHFSAAHTPGKLNTVL